MLARLSADLQVGDLIAVGRRGVTETLDRMAGRTAGVSDWVSWLDPSTPVGASPADSAPSRRDEWTGDGVARTAGGYIYEPLSNDLSTVIPAPDADPARRTILA